MRATANQHRILDWAPEIERAYDLSARFYDDWKWQRFWRRTEAPVILAFLDEYLAGCRREAKLIDVGCGTGWYLSRLSHHLTQSVGADISGGMLNVARERAPTAELVQASATSLPFDSATFDAVLCTRVLPHIAEVERALLELARLVRPGGVLVLSSIDEQHEYDDTGLPSAGAKIRLKAFAHSKAEIGKLLLGAGLTDLFTTLVIAGSEPEPVKHRCSMSNSAKPVGWLSIWRRPG